MTSTNPGTHKKIKLGIFVNRLLVLHKEKRATEEEIRNVYSNSSDNGYDASILRKVIERLHINVETENELDNQEAEDMCDFYLTLLDPKIIPPAPSLSEYYFTDDDEYLDPTDPTD